MGEAATHLDLFSGIGGFGLAARWAGFRTIGFCEIDKYCQRVLAKNFGAKIVGNSGSTSTAIHTDQQWRQAVSKLGKPGETLADTQRDGLDGAQEPAGARGGQDQGRLLQPEGSDEPPRLIPDIRELNGADFYGVDLLTGGFPCQPFSHAGLRRGASDDRHLWPEMLRVIKEARPAWVVGENVPGIIAMELDNVLSDLEGIGYATRSFVIPACAVDARHRRDRVWVIGRRNVCDSEHAGLNASEISGSVGTGSNRSAAWAQQTSESTRSDQQQEQLADTSGLRLEGCEKTGNDSINRAQSRIELSERLHGSEGTNGEREALWLPEPDVGRVAHGVPSELDGDIDEALRVLWQGNGSTEMVKREIGRYVEASSVLFDKMLRRLDHLAEQGETDKWPKASAAKTEASEVRSLWLSKWFTATSSRQESTEQRIIKPSGAMPEMSQGRPFEGRDVGSVWLQEPDIPRVAHGVKERVNRLKGLGNAIVPQVAYEILREIRKLI